MQIQMNINREWEERPIKDDLVRIITSSCGKTFQDITLRSTNSIRGFPGETEEQHKELLEFVQEMKFDRSAAFTYSPEEGTKAAEMENQIPEGTKEAVATGSHGASGRNYF